MYDFGKEGRKGEGELTAQMMDAKGGNGTGTGWRVRGLLVLFPLRFFGMDLWKKGS